jgi:primosomal protein N' (replication factor Y)
MNPAHPVLTEVLTEDMPRFYERELAERKQYFYPPFARLIQIQLRHKKPQSLETATKLFDLWLREALGDWVYGPAAPYVGRVRNYYLMDFLVKMDRDPAKLRHAKLVVRTAAEKLLAEPGLSSTRVVVDVDP